MTHSFDTYSSGKCDTKFENDVIKKKNILIDLIVLLRNDGPLDAIKIKWNMIHSLHKKSFLIIILEQNLFFKSIF